MQNVNEIDELIKIISKLPGLGPKSAKRIVLKLINNKDELVKPMANILVQIYSNRRHLRLDTFSGRRFDISNDNRCTRLRFVQCSFCV